MPKRSSRPIDINQLAASIIDEATEHSSSHEKNPAAVALGRLGGLKGGKARAEKLSAKRRKSIATKAAMVRWQKQTTAE
ncbi:MAG: hypothetical protein NTW68_11380 [candidate division NC10 bacterium]|nr:hypothetical protein [candidate division NC10 bacterium]